MDAVSLSSSYRIYIVTGEGMFAPPRVHCIMYHHILVVGNVPDLDNACQYIIFNVDALEAHTAFVKFSHVLREVSDRLYKVWHQLTRRLLDV